MDGLINLTNLNRLISEINEDIIVKNKLSAIETIYSAEEMKRYYKWLMKQAEHKTDMEKSVKDFISMQHDKARKIQKNTDSSKI